MTGWCSEKKANFKTKKLLIKYEKIIPKIMKITLCKWSFISIGVIVGAYMPLPADERSIPESKSSAVMLCTLSTLESYFHYHIFNLCFLSNYHGNCWISHYRKPAFHKYYMCYYCQTVSVFKDIQKFCNWGDSLIFSNFNEYKWLIFIKNRTKYPSNHYSCDWSAPLS